MKKQKGFSLIELLIVVAIILIIAAIAIPNLMRSKMAANESSAISSLRTINTAEVTYATVYPGVGYSNDLPSLGGTPAVCSAPGGASSATACIIDEVLATATTLATAKSGYYFSYALGAAVGGINTAYTVTATPTVVGTAGQRNFFTDQSGVLRYGLTGPATLNSSAIQ
ncbi:MAG: prepilin-type N-terminal cleavage/methylation domain-containing protein [Candidatus Acidiferrales bacterium]